MFNNLGLFSPRRPAVPITRRSLPRPVSQFGGAGNDFFLTGTLNVPGGPGATGATGPAGPQGDVGATGPSGPPGLLSPVPVTIAETSPYIALSTDYFIGSTVLDGVIVLPTNPATGTTYIVKDITGTATNADPIVITNDNTFDGAATAEIQTNYGSLTFIFNGIEWNII